MKYSIESQLGTARFARLVKQAKGYTPATLETAARSLAERFFPVDDSDKEKRRLLTEPLHAALATQEALRLAGSNAQSEKPLVQAARKGAADYEQALAERHAPAADAADADLAEKAAGGATEAPASI